MELKWSLHRRSRRFRLMGIIGSVFALIMLLLALATTAQAEPLADQLVVYVDGRPVGVEREIEAELNGKQATLDEVLAELGSAETTAQQIQVVVPPDNSELPIKDVVATIEGRRIDISNLSQTLAAHNRIQFWISGALTNGWTWRICVTITWNNAKFPVVTVDGSDVKVEGVQAQIDARDVDYAEVLALLGDEKILSPTLEFFDPKEPTVPLTLTGVSGIVQANHIDLTGLTNELARRGRIGIWVSGSRWRICVVISWARQANPEVTVDGREVKVDGLEAEIDGEKVDYGRVLALLGDQKIFSPTLEFFDPEKPTVPLTPTGVSGVVQANRIDLTGLSNELARRGRIGIWVSGSRWRICIVISWARQANPEVTVDGREVKVDGLEAEIDGEKVDYGRVLALLGDQKIFSPTLEFFDPEKPTVPLTPTGVSGVVQANRIDLTGLSNELARRGRIGIWVSGSRWRICVVISWARQANPEVTVDGREVKVDGLEAEIDGEKVDYRRVLALLGDQKILSPTLEFFDPNAENAALLLPAVQAVVQANHIDLTGLSNELARRGRIGIWVSGSRWRICIVISWARQANPEVTVDGREVKVDGLEAEIDGEKVDYGRVLALLGDQKIFSPTLEFFDPNAENAALLLPAVQAVVQANRIDLTGLTNELARRGRIGIWVSGSRWRICIVISWARQANPEVTVDGREVKVDGLEAEIDGEKVDYRRVLALLGDQKIFSPTLEFFDPAEPTVPLTLTGVSGMVQTNHMDLTGLSNELARRGRIGIWISGSRWRICIIISLGTDNNPRVFVDGRAVTAYRAEATMDGVDVEPRQVMALLAGSPITAEKVEVVDNDNQPIQVDNVSAIVNGNRILLTNLSSTLAARGRVGVWVSGTTFGIKWRVCVVVVWGRFSSNDGVVTVDLAESDIHTDVKVTYTSVTSPTSAPPANTEIVYSFQLDAESETGAPVLQFDKPYTLTVHYTDEELAAAGVTEETLQLAYWDEDQQQWVPIPTTADADNNVAYGILNHLTEFAMWGAEPGTSTKKIHLPLVNR